jgi:hypothetical protein
MTIFKFVRKENVAVTVLLNRQEAEKDLFQSLLKFASKSKLQNYLEEMKYEVINLLRTLPLALLDHL